MAANRTERLSELPAYSVSQARLKSLYSDFSRQRVSNPASYTSNIDWWRRALPQFVARGLQEDTSDTLILHASPEMAESLRYEGVGKPLGLAAILNELQDSRNLIPVDEFMKSTTTIYYPGSLIGRVASYMVAKPLWWALEHLTIIEPEGHFHSDATLWKRVRGSHVVLSNLEKAADAVVERQRQKGAVSPSDVLYSYESFKKEFGEIGDAGLALSDDDMRVLVKFLDRDKGVIVADRDVIKFIDPSVEVPSKTITAVDRGIVELKSGVENMEAQVEDLNRRISEKTQKATENLRANRKDVALTHLKMRKQLEDLLRKRLGSLEILQSTLVQVEGAAQDIEIMKQYESSTATLRALLAHPSLQRAHIDETMDAMAEATAAHREVDDAIRLGGALAASDAGIDEQELEAELAALVQDVTREEIERQEVKEKEDAEARGAKLPSVPQAEPERGRESRTALRETTDESTDADFSSFEAKDASRELSTREAS